MFTHYCPYRLSILAIYTMIFCCRFVQVNCSPRSKDYRRIQFFNESSPVNNDFWSHILSMQHNIQVFLPDLMCQNEELVECRLVRISTVQFSTVPCINILWSLHICIALQPYISALLYCTALHSVTALCISLLCCTLTSPSEMMQCVSPTVPHKCQRHPTAPLSLLSHPSC